MSADYRFLASPTEPSEVMAWFRSLEFPAEETPTGYGVVLYFRSFGPLAYLTDGSIDADASPVVTVVLPQVRRGILWTVGEVHFRATPLRKQFPALNKINGTFSKWLSSFECVFSTKRHENPYNYYLEGSVQNRDAQVFAFSSGLEALKDGRYFVDQSESEPRLDTICKTLRLRGLQCTGA